jgi:hypothetical protein
MTRISLWRSSILAAAIAIAGGCGGGGGGGIPFISYPVNFAVAAGDFAHDGRTGVASVGAAISNQTNYVDVFLPGSNGQYANPVMHTIVPLYVSLTAVDLNHDGLPDLIAFNETTNSGSILMLFNDPAQPGTFNTQQTLTVGAPVGNVAFGDLNGDGLIDLAVANGSDISVFQQNTQAPGTFQGPQIVSSNSTGGVAIGDLNGDHLADIAISTPNGLTVLFQSGTTPGTYQAVPLGTISDAGARYIYIADVDGDGLNDLIVSGPADASGSVASVLVLLQDRQNPGHFLAPVSYATLGDAFNAVIVDLTGTGNGLPDLVVGASGGASVLLHDPAHPGSFLAAANYTQTDSTGLTVGDVNGDGLPDIIVPNFSGSTTVPFPGVLLQDAAHPGQFLPLSSL